MFEYQSDMKADGTPGDVLGKFLELRKAVGVLKAKKKDGVRFKVRSADELVDRIRPLANELGLLIYPAAAHGTGEVVKDEDGGGGTYACVTVTTRIKALSDGTYIDVVGFGLGVDNQDKAGGKAGTYAMKTGLVQALLAGGAEDTDDTDTPLKGGPRKAAPKAKPGFDTVKAAFDNAGTEEQYRAAVPLLAGLTPDQQLAVRDTVIAAKARCLPPKE